MVHANVKYKPTLEVCISPTELGGFYVHSICDYLFLCKTISESNLWGCRFCFLKKYMGTQGVRLYSSYKLASYTVVMSLLHSSWPAQRAKIIKKIW